MNNFKKIGLTALAGSLVATSVYAGEMSVAGSASWRISNHSGTDGGKTMAIVLPPSVPLWLLILHEAEPATDISPAYTEVATKEPANAVSPIFLKLFILITPYWLIVIINNKQAIFIIWM